MKLPSFAHAVALGAALAACSGPFDSAQGDSVPGQGDAALHPNTTTKYNVLFSFGSSGLGADGIGPSAPLLDMNGTLYGTTFKGGANGYGAVFSISTSGKEKTLYSFKANGDGATPYGGLAAVKGTLYGTTYAGGATGYGTVFSVTTSGEEHVVHSFTDNGSDGLLPVAGPIDVNGTLYGTTSNGGAFGYGTVYSMSTSGEVHILHSFSSAPDGGDPFAPLVDVKGMLYGATIGGGEASGYKDRGTIFRISTAGAEKVLFSFDGADGGVPFAAPLDVNGTLYGTTQYGGLDRTGTVYSLSANGKERVLHSFGSVPSDGVRPASSLIDVNGTLYGTTQYGGGGGTACQGLECGTIFSISPSGKERIVHRFEQGYKNDGAFPMAGFVEVRGRLYGTTQAGGYAAPSCTSTGPCDYGTVYALTP